MDPRELFTDRATDYAKFRPGYPDELIEHLCAQCGLCATSTVADIGSGTGIFANQLTGTEATVYAVEPNDGMRAESERSFGTNSQFRSVPGSAEQVPLDDGSVDLVTAAQSFHWFDAARARREFERVLKPPGWVALVWNVRMVKTTAFQKGYEELLRLWAPTYTGAQHHEDEAERIRLFFAPATFEKTSFPNPQFLFWEELRGRAMSASYFPLPGDSAHEPAVDALRELFEDNKQGGRVDFDYSTELFLGKLKPG